MRQPKNIMEIRDNEGRSFDRYTIVLNDMGDKFHDCLGLSENPAQPQGFSQFSPCIPGDHLGKAIKWTDLSKDLQKHVIDRLK